MTKIDKRTERVLQKPPRKDIEFEELVLVLERYGFKTTRISGSHYNFKNTLHPEVSLDSIPKPHGDNKYVKRSYITIAQNAIEAIKTKELNDEGKK